MAGKVFSDIYTESARDTGDQTTSHITYVKKKVNDALRDMCSFMLFDFMRRSTTLTLTANTQGYLASTFISSTWDEQTPVNIWYRGADNSPVELDSFDEHEWREEEDTDEGDCYGFHITKESGSWKVLFTLVPSSSFVSSYSPLNVEYYVIPTELSAAGDIPEIPTAHHQLLVYWTNKLICAEMGDDAGLARWNALAESSMSKMIKRQVHRLGRPKRVYPRGYLTGKSTRQLRDY